MNERSGNLWSRFAESFAFMNGKRIEQDLEEEVKDKYSHVKVSERDLLDTHPAKRLSNLMGWISEATKTPEALGLHLNEYELFSRQLASHMTHILLYRDRNYNMPNYDLYLTPLTMNLLRKQFPPDSQLQLDDCSIERSDYYRAMNYASGETMRLIGKNISDTKALREFTNNLEPFLEKQQNAAFVREGNFYFLSSLPEFTSEDFSFGIRNDLMRKREAFKNCGEILDLPKIL